MKTIMDRFMKAPYGFVEDDPNKHGHNWKNDYSKDYAIMYRSVKR